MPVRTLPYTDSAGMPITRLRACLRSWVLDIQASRASKQYVAKVQMIAEKLLWWVETFHVAAFDADCCREWLLYLQTAHELPEGRWGTPGETRADIEGRLGTSASIRYRPASAGTVRDYHRRLSSFCAWCVEQNVLEHNPLDKIKRPIHRDRGRFHVFTADELRRITESTRRRPRDKAIVLMLLDTGLRATELVSLRWSDLDLVERRASVVGKGDKRRTVYWSAETGRALWAWSQKQRIGKEDEPDQDDYVFISIGGNTPGQQLGRYGLRDALYELGRKAQVDACHPHTFRHTFAVLYLLSGGQQMALRELMGHESLQMTDKYVRFTGADIAGQARLHSPVQFLNRKKR